MALIPFPNVPNYPGVPAIPRTSPGTPNITIALSNLNAAFPNTPASTAWGIFDTNSGEALYKTLHGTLSTFSIAFTRAMSISDFPIEANTTGQGAAFASFNKVWQPANPIVTVAVSGLNSDLSGFLTALDAACTSTELYDVITPDAAYMGYSIESYSYQRTAQRGATMLMVEISLKQILQVQPSYTSSPINAPQSPSAANSQNAGVVQTTTAPQSVLSKLLHPLGVGGPQ